MGSSKNTEKGVRKCHHVDSHRRVTLRHKYHQDFKPCLSLLTTLLPVLDIVQSCGRDGENYKHFLNLRGEVTCLEPSKETLERAETTTFPRYNPSTEPDEETYTHGLHLYKLVPIPTYHHVF